jgi:hypothetical protein
LLCAGKIAIEKGKQKGRTQHDLGLEQEYRLDWIDGAYIFLLMRDESEREEVVV